MRGGFAERKGFVLPWMAITLPAVVLFMGLVLDMGVYMVRGQMLDAATDAAALAATSAWDRNSWLWNGQVQIDPGAATSLARQYLAQNMPSAELIQVTVSPSNRVNVQTQTTVPFFFLRSIGWRTRTITSYATAVRRNVR